MKRFTRLLGSAVLCVFLFAVAAPATVSWTGWGDWDLGRASRALLRESRRGDVLEARERSLKRCTEAKAEVVNDLAAGRLTLTEAARCFRELNEQMNDGNDDLLGVYPQPRDEEALCRSVIVFIRAGWAGESVRITKLASRLEAEFRRRFPATKLDPV